MDKMDDIKRILKEAYGFSDEQLSEEFDRIKKLVDLGGGEPGDYASLRKRIEELEKKQ